MKTALRPFWSFFGGKWRSAPRYPKPLHDTIVEPFAGAAGYSMRYPELRVVLVEKDPVIAEMWRYLTTASEAEVLRLPLVRSTDDLPARTPQGARALIGFWMNHACTSPRRRVSADSLRLAQRTDAKRRFAFWGEAVRERVASQLEAIRHWQIIEADYSALRVQRAATWFIDPPYNSPAGEQYRCGSKDIDFPALAAWCRARRGQVIVCETQGADWLPFKPFGLIKAGRRGTSAEAIWYRGGDR